MKTVYTITMAWCVVMIVCITACRTHFKTEQVSFPVNITESQLEEGRKLTISICAPCHYNPDTKQLTGIQMHDLPKVAGTVYSRNITQDKDKGIADYTDGELAYLIRTGIARDGSLMPYMQRPNLADSDLAAIIAFLHSNDPLVQPSKEEPPTTHYTAIGKFGINHFPGPLKYPSASIPKPDIKDKVVYGKYLVDNLSCYHCHSASFTSVNELQPEKSKRYMGGGNKLKDGKGKVILSANVTFDTETGIGSWNEADFKKAIKEGVSKDGSVLHFLMPRYTELSDEEISAIYSYLSGIPKIKHKVKH
jgi:cytochrome c553